MTDIPMQQLKASLAASTAQSTAFTRFYPVHTLPPGTSLVYRPVAPAETEADPVVLPWVEGREHTFTLAGMIGSDSDTHNPVTVRVPCIAQWGLNCPILADIKPLWDGSPADKDRARRYYPRKSYNMYVFIVSSPIVEKSVPENPIRPFRLGPQAFKPFHNGLMGDDFEFAPWSVEHGRNHVLSASLQAGFRHYEGKWLFRESPWTAEQRAAREKYGAPVLADLNGPVPDQSVQDLIWQLYQDSLAGKPFDNRLYGAHFKAYAERPNNKSNGAAAEPQPTAENHAAALEQLAVLRAKNTSVTTPTA